jgi:integration host factor subunit alpha
MSEKTITRADLSEALRKKCSLSRTQSFDTIETILGEISEILKEEGEVKIPLFGVFFVRHKKERMGRNPRTLESARIKARQVVGFRISRLMKARVDERLKKKATK